MSAIVAYQDLLRRVSPSLVVTAARRPQGAATATPVSLVSPASPLATSGSSAAGLQALLGRVGLSGPDGTTVAGSTTASADPADAKAKLQKALTTLLDALKGGSSDTAASQSAPAVDAAIQTVLGALGPLVPAAPGQAAPSVTTDASGQGIVAAPLKPNLDALHRVLTHYTAQSAAASTVVTLVR